MHIDFDSLRARKLPLTISCNEKQDAKPPGDFHSHAPYNHGGPSWTGSLGLSVPLGAPALDHDLGWVRALHRNHANFLMTRLLAMTTLRVKTVDTEAANQFHQARKMGRCE